MKPHTIVTTMGVPSAIAFEVRGGDKNQIQNMREGKP